MSHNNFAVVFYCFGDWQFTFSGLLATDYLPFEFLASVEVDAFRISHVTASPNYVEIVFLTNGADGVIVSDAKGVRVGRLKLVENFAILICALGE